MPSMVAAAMTPLMPGAGPPPTKIPNLPLLMWMYMSMVDKNGNRDRMLGGGKEFNSILAIFQPQFAGMNRAIFLDRDGTLIAEKNYLSRPEDVKIGRASCR